MALLVSYVPLSLMIDFGPAAQKIEFRATLRPESETLPRMRKRRLLTN